MDSYLPENLPVCSLETILWCRNSITGLYGDGPLCWCVVSEQRKVGRDQHDRDVVREAQAGVGGGGFVCYWIVCVNMVRVNSPCRYGVMLVELLVERQCWSGLHG